MKFSYNWLAQYLKTPPSPQKMAEFLMLHAFEVESVEKKDQDWVLDIKVLPNRAHDCSSHLGIAKEIAAISGSQFLPPEIKLVSNKSLKIKDFISVEVPAKDLCPRYSMMMVADIKVGPSPKWMQERLVSCGLRPINNIVDITNYVMLETGEPLHAFDLEKIGGQKIIVRPAHPGEEIVTLEGKKYQLNKNNLVIADAKVAVGIAGIKGGQGPEIDAKTRNIVIEAANFEPTNIRRTSKALNLKTDASTRFENGLDQNLTIFALKRCVSLMVGLAEGKAASGLIDIWAKKIVPRKIILHPEKIENLLGLKIKTDKIIDILKRLDIKSKAIKKGKKEFIEVIVPTERLDITIQEDLIEEIVRIYGYEKIPAKMPVGLIIPALKTEELAYEEKIKETLVGLGLSEVYNYSFISEDDQKIFKFGQIIEIKNPLSQEQKFLRPFLVINLLKNVKENLKHFSIIQLFELGHVFWQDGGQYQEANKISAIICQKDISKSTDNLFELKGAIEILFEKLGMADIWFDDAIEEKYEWLKLVHSFRRAEIKSGDNLLGWVAELNPAILGQLGIKERVAAFEIDFGVLVKLASEERIYLPPSRYPAIIRDLAVVVEQTTKIEQVFNAIETAGGPLLQDTDLFDIYEGLNGDRKSLTFRLVYQSDERNLTDKEVNELQEKIIKAVEEQGWEVRK